MNDELIKVVDGFKIFGKCQSVAPYGFGLINRTYVAVCSDGNKTVRYILQAINDKIFKDVDALMKNITGVTSFMRRAIENRGGDIYRETLNVIPTLDDKNYLYSDGKYYRLYVFIENATAYQTVEDPRHFYQSGVALALFEQLLSAYPANELSETIPAFHNTRRRYDAFELAYELDACDRFKLCYDEVAFAKQNKGLCDPIEAALENARIPKRVTHNDTKFNNVMFDDATGKAVCLIDLDTVMPGSALYDFGDAIRSGCNPRLENEKDLSTVIFDIDLFREYTNGYAVVAKDFITDEEKELLPLAPMIMTYECGIRFLTDYLCGDTYFKINYPEENLDRTRTQFKLVRDMQENFEEIKKIVREAFQ